METQEHSVKFDQLDNKEPERRQLFLLLIGFTFHRVSKKLFEATRQYFEPHKPQANAELTDFY